MITVPQNSAKGSLRTILTLGQNHFWCSWTSCSSFSGACGCRPKLARVFLRLDDSECACEFPVAADDPVLALLSSSSAAGAEKIRFCRAVSSSAQCCVKGGSAVTVGASIEGSAVFRKGRRIGRRVSHLLESKAQQFCVKHHRIQFRL
jgi:hypothetical protein